MDSSRPFPSLDPGEPGGELDALRVQVRHLRNECDLSRREYESAARNYLDALSRLESQNAELESLNAHLEDRVRERTLLLDESNRRLRERESRAAAQRAAIARLALDKSIVDGETDLALRRIAEVSADTLSASRVGIWILSEDASSLRCVALFDSCSREHSSAPPVDARSFPRFFQALAAESHLRVDDVLADPRTAELASSRFRPDGVASLLAAAVLVEGRLSGIVACEQFAPGRRWESDEESFVGTMAAFAAQVFATERRIRAEEEKNLLEERLMQAQKMDAVGRLAGGVAHDFNNMLSVIVGNAEMALETIPPDQPLHADVREILHAAERSADLTRQLLAFARTQPAKPQTIDVNAALEGMLKMLRRLIGESFVLSWNPDPDAGLVHVDPSQLHQILVNLCLNARDASGDNGAIAIETFRTAVGDSDRARRAGALPGPFVRLSVRDCGCGMDAQTLGHLFEPFFTTKEVGKGTGLGLSTVYGIVCQNGGFVDVESLPGKGSTFSVFLPRVDLPADAPPPPVDVCPPSTGTETILLVEDDPAILHMVATLLRRLGYSVLPAPLPGEALRIAHSHPGPIDLLLADLVMPEMNGCELANRIDSLRPGIRRLFMSGHATEVLARQGILHDDVHFLPKPFSIRMLAAKVRESIGA